MRQSDKIIPAEMYLHPAFKEVIKEEFFSGKSAFGMRNLDEFTSSNNSPEPELPVAMVALTAAAVSEQNRQDLLFTNVTSVPCCDYVV